MAEKTTNTAVYSKKIKASGKTYFFDVKNMSKGGKYLTVAESRKLPDGSWKRNNIIVFEGGADEFVQGLTEVVEELKK